MGMPPCWRKGEKMNLCAKANYDREVYNKTPLHDAWAGWRMAGRDLVAPDGQRINPQRLRGLMFRDELELRRAGYTSRKKAEKQQLVKVVVVQLDEYRRNGIGIA